MIVTRILVTLEDVEKEEEKEEEEKMVRRRGGWKMLGFYHSLYFTVCTSELFTNKTHFTIVSTLLFVRQNSSPTKHILP